MPKQKTNKSVASRVKVTGSGKLMHRGQGRKKHLSAKSGNKKRHLARERAIPAKEASLYKNMIGV